MKIKFSFNKFFSILSFSILKKIQISKSIVQKNLSYEDSKFDDLVWEGVKKFFLIQTLIPCNLKGLTLRNFIKKKFVCKKCIK